jgi:hypothetical protein
MRTRRLQFGLGSLLVLTTVCAIASQWWLRGPVIRAAIEPVGFLAQDGETYAATFRITNAGPETLWYTGYGHQSPLYLSEAEVGGQWTPLNDNWCGTGASSQELKAGEAIVFSVRLRQGATAMKAGLDLSTRQPEFNGLDSEDSWVVVWSKPLRMPAQLNAPVQTASRTTDP